MTIMNFDKKLPVLYAHRLAGLLNSLGTSFLIVLLYSIWSEINRFVIGSSELTHDQCKVGANSFNVGVGVITNKEAAKNRQFLSKFPMVINREKLHFSRCFIHQTNSDRLNFHGI